MAGEDLAWRRTCGQGRAAKRAPAPRRLGAVHRYRRSCVKESSRKLHWSRLRSANVRGWRSTLCAFLCMCAIASVARAQNPCDQLAGLISDRLMVRTKPGVAVEQFLGLDGQIYEMSGLLHVGAHAGTTEWNRRGLGLAFQGDYTSHLPADRMLAAAVEIIDTSGAPYDQWGHRDVRPDPTACPGNRLYAYMPLEVGMSKQDVLEALGEFFGWSASVDDPKGDKNPDGTPRKRRYVQAVVESTWHAAHGRLDGKTAKTLDWLTRPLAEVATPELAAIAKAVNDELDRRQRQRLG